MQRKTNLIEKLSSKWDYMKAFTIVELLIALGLFVVIISIAAFGFVRGLRTQQAIVALMGVNDSISLTLEQFSREARTGYHFCTYTSQTSDNRGECNNLKPDDSEIMFANADNQTVRYRWDATDGAIERAVNDQNYEKITADNVKVSRFNIDLLNPERTAPQTRIVVSLTVESANPLFQYFSTNLQTTISPRILDNEQ